MYNINKRLLLLFCLIVVSSIVLYILRLSIPFNFNDRQSRESTPTAIGKKKVILIWTPVFGERSIRPINPSSECSNTLDGQCVVTFDHSKVSQADALVFHAWDINVRDLPRVKVEGQVNVFFTLETLNTLLNLTTGMQNLPRNYFHWTMTFLSKSDIHWPYGDYFIAPEKALQTGHPLLKLPYDKRTIFKDKMIKGALWFASNCEANSKREVAIKALAKYMRIDIGGKCGDRRLCSRKPNSPSSCDDLKRKYYFYIAIENDICIDYITEKYYNHFELPVILIVMHRRIYENLVPPNFIAMDDFAGPKEMAAYLIYLMDSPEAYLRHFAWRSKNWALAPLNSEGHKIGLCALCDKLWTTTKMPEVIPDVFKLYKNTLNCTNGDEFVSKWVAND